MEQVELTIDIGRMEFSSTDSEGSARFLSMSKMVVELAVEISKDALLNTLRCVTGCDALSWDDLTRKMRISHYGEDGYRYIFKVDFYYKDGREINFAAMLEKTIGLFGASEFQCPVPLEGCPRPRFTPFLTAKDGRSWYAQEFAFEETFDPFEDPAG